MGLLDWIKGRRRAAPGVPRIAAAALRKRLLDINRKTAPFIVRDGKPEGVDLVAEWKIVDAKWYQLFAKAGIKRVFKVLMKFDASASVVRVVDHEWTVEWEAGVPTLSARAEGSSGRKWEKSFETVYAFREDLSYGKVYDYRFDTDEIKGPLIEIVRNAGWDWQSVAFGKL